MTSVINLSLFYFGEINVVYNELPLLKGKYSFYYQNKYQPAAFKLNPHQNAEL